MSAIFWNEESCQKQILKVGHFFLFIFIFIHCHLSNFVIPRWYWYFLISYIYSLWTISTFTTTVPCWNWYNIVLCLMWAASATRLEYLIYNKFNVIILNYESYQKHILKCWTFFSFSYLFCLSLGKFCFTLLMLIFHIVLCLLWSTFAEGTFSHNKISKQNCHILIIVLCCCYIWIHDFFLSLMNSVNFFKTTKVDKNKFWNVKHFFCLSLFLLLVISQILLALVDTNIVKYPIFTVYLLLSIVQLFLMKAVKKYCIVLIVSSKSYWNC